MAAALGLIETHGIAHSIVIADQMLKMADVHLASQEEVSQAFYTIRIEGDIESVRLAIEQGVAIARAAGVLIAYKVIPRPVEETRTILSTK